MQFLCFASIIYFLSRHLYIFFHLFPYDQDIGGKAAGGKSMAKSCLPFHNAGKWAGSNKLRLEILQSGERAGRNKNKAQNPTAIDGLPLNMGCPKKFRLWHKEKFWGAGVLQGELSIIHGNELLKETPFIQFMDWAIPH